MGEVLVYILGEDFQKFIDYYAILQGEIEHIDENGVMTGTKYWKFFAEQLDSHLKNTENDIFIRSLIILYLMDPRRETLIRDGNNWIVGMIGNQLSAICHQYTFNTLSSVIKQFIKAELPVEYRRKVIEKQGWDERACSFFGL